MQAAVLTSDGWGSGSNDGKGNDGGWGGPPQSSTANGNDDGWDNGSSEAKPKETGLGGGVSNGTEEEDAKTNSGLISNDFQVQVGLMVSLSSENGR